MSAKQHHCQLCLTLPNDPGANARSVLDAVLGDCDFACVLLQSPPEGRIDRSLASDLRHAAVQREVAFLVQNDLEAALELGADGLHIGADRDLLARARAALAPDVQIGVQCGLQRHRAMDLGEAGADYVAFGDDTTRSADAISEPLCELIEWWAEIFVLPCVAWGVGGARQGLAYAERGADFIALDEELWFRPETLMQTAAELAAGFAAAQDAA